MSSGLFVCIYIYMYIFVPIICMNIVLVNVVSPDLNCLDIDRVYHGAKGNIYM